MRNFLRIATGVNVTPLMLALARRPDLWKEDTYLRDYPQGPFGEIESIMLRFQEKRGFDQKAAVDSAQNGGEFYDQHESIDYPAYAQLPEARSLVMGVFSSVAGERLGRVMINKIAPGGVIYPHADSKAHAEYYSRFHVVLQSSEGVRFRCGNEWAYWETGSVFWMRNSIEHEVINESNSDRIHLIVDARCSK